MANVKSELVVITYAKNLAEYVFVITESSPKKFRMTLVLRMQNYVLGIVEALYRANDVYVAPKDVAARARRLEQQNKALTTLRLLGYLGELGSKRQCITAHQFEEMCRLINMCQSTLINWMSSDKKRFEQQ